MWLIATLRSQKTGRKLAKSAQIRLILRSKEVAKKYLFEGEDACMFYVSQIYPMVSRELVRWTKIVAKRMKPRSSLSNPWSVKFSRNMPQEVFDLLKLTILKGHYGFVSKTTSCVETLELTAANSAREWIMHVGNKTSSEITMASILYKLLKCGSHCEAVICADNPLIIKYSKSQENIKVSLRYGCWNTFGVPQHSF
jgi:hypothetical protein